MSFTVTRRVSQENRVRLADASGYQIAQFQELTCPDNAASATQFLKQGGLIVRGKPLAGRMDRSKMQTRPTIRHSRAAGMQDATVSVTCWIRACAGMTLRERVHIKQNLGKTASLARMEKLSCTGIAIVVDKCPRFRCLIIQLHYSAWFERGYRPDCRNRQRSCGYLANCYRWKRIPVRFQVRSSRFHGRSRQVSSDRDRGCCCRSAKTFVLKTFVA
jgi:hypothetical protein